jgi:hypothetical protein
MRHHPYQFAAASLLIGLWFSGCSPKTKTITEENDVKWDSIRVEKTYHLLENPDNPSCNLQINFTFPAGYENKEVLAAIRRHFILASFGEPYAGLTPEEAAERYAVQYLADYKELEKDFASDHDAHASNGDHEYEANHDDAWYSYYEYFFNEVIYNHNDLLSYAVSNERYTGGAHGSHSYRNHIIDLKTGIAMEEADFFVEGYQDALAEILVKKIAEKNKAEKTEDLLNMGYFSLDEIYPNGNFSIGDEGITYYFNEYEIAAFVVGITDVFIPYGELRHLLRADDERISTLTGY